MGLNLPMCQRSVLQSTQYEEAQAVAEAVLHHAQHRPGESLGVVAMSSSNAIKLSVLSMNCAEIALNLTMQSMAYMPWKSHFCEKP
jgi:uncharacterized phosphosugar-binding protein